MSDIVKKRAERAAQHIFEVSLQARTPQQCAAIIAAEFAPFEKLVEAARAAHRTYLALARNHKMLAEALQAKGWPSDWLGMELEKAERLRAALEKIQAKRDVAA